MTAFVDLPIIRHRLFQIVCAVIVLAGCETLPSEPIGSLGKVEVVSALGSEMQQLVIGTTAFQNKEEYVSIEEWDLDTTAESILVQSIEGASSVEAIPDLRPYLYVPEEQRVIYLLSGVERFDPIDAVDRYLAETNRPRADTYILLMPVDFKFPELYGPANFFGTGIYTRSFFGSKNIMPFAAARLLVLRGEELTEVRGRLLRSPSPVREGVFVSDIGIGTDRNFNKSLDALTFEEQVAKSEPFFLKYLEKSLPDALELSGVNPPTQDPDE